MTLKEFAQTIISVGKLQEEQVSLSNIGNGERKLLHYYCSLFQKELLNFFKMLQKQRNAFLKNVNTCSIQGIPIHFVREIQIVPEVSVLVATSQQLLDVVRFCTNALNSSIMLIQHSIWESFTLL